MLTDQKMKSKQSTAPCLFQRVSLSDLHGLRLQTTNRLVCPLYQGLSSDHVCGLKATDELERNGRFFTVSQFHAAASMLRRAPAVPVISFHCPLEPLYILSTLCRVSHHLINSVKGPGC